MGNIIQGIREIKYGIQGTGKEKTWSTFILIACIICVVVAITAIALLLLGKLSRMCIFFKYVVPILCLIIVPVVFFLIGKYPDVIPHN